MQSDLSAAESTGAAEGETALEYRVTATIHGRALAAEYIAWLRAGHLQEVVEGGAREARLLELKESAEGGDAEAEVEVESVYIFSSEAAFARYEIDFAPAIRAEGIALFGERPIRVARRVSRLHLELSRSHGA